jgi:hypothetical protein
MSRIPHSLDNRLTDGGKVDSLTLLLPQKPSDTHFCYFLGIYFLFQNLGKNIAILAAALLATNCFVIENYIPVRAQINERRRIQ